MGWDYSCKVTTIVKPGCVHEDGPLCQWPCNLRGCVPRQTEAPTPCPVSDCGLAVPPLDVKTLLLGVLLAAALGLSVWLGKTLRQGKNNMQPSPVFNRSRLTVPRRRYFPTVAECEDEERRLIYAREREEGRRRRLDRRDRQGYAAVGAEGGMGGVEEAAGGGSVGFAGAASYHNVSLNVSRPTTPDERENR